MSASLVGSEMCIRDRRQGAPAPQPRGLPPGCLPGGEVVATRQGLPPREPVSYTHLTLPTICSV
eukprot:6765178-Alexandrium_andersonii.AAC.1